jgi:hypothetical protein
MASNASRKPVGPQIPQLCLTESSPRNPSVRTSMGWTIQSARSRILSFEGSNHIRTSLEPRQGGHSHS